MNIEPDEDYESDISAVSGVSKVSSVSRKSKKNKLNFTFNVKPLIISIISLILSIIISKQSLNVIKIAYQTIIFVASYIILYFLNKLRVF